MSVFVKRAVTLAALPSHNLFYFLRFHPFSSSISTDKSLEESSFAVNYLINSCGFSPKKAISASNYLKFKEADRPDSVLAFFKDHGFTRKQILKLISIDPGLLLRDPNKAILPKIDFLKTKEISGSDIVAIISAHPRILRKSLENNLIQPFNFLSSFLQSDKKAAATLKNLAGYLGYRNVDHIKSNIEVLEKAGVPIENIRYLVVLLPRTIMVGNIDKLRQITEEAASELGVDPLNINFVIALHVLNSISKSVRQKKVEIYKRWGWSERDIFHAFNKFPMCMALSENKITSVMELLVNKMRMKSFILVDRPILLSLSLEKRIVPRCELYQALVSKGVIRHCDIKLATIIRNSYKYFEENFVKVHEEAYPELIKQYKQKVGSCKIEGPLED